MHEIRFCRLDERDHLMSFIHTDWRADHVLSKNAELLDWQHLDRINNRYNFVVAVNEATGRFDGILGFIPLYHYDSSLTDKVHLWLAIWKVAKERVTKLTVGLDLLRFLEEELQPASIGAVGINEQVAKLYRLLGFTTGALDQFYIFDDDRSDFTLMKPGSRTMPICVGQPRCVLRDVDGPAALDALEFFDTPRKSPRYIIERYQNHVSYRYRLIGAWEGDLLRGLFVIRRAEANGAGCLRIVDFVGSVEALGPLRSEFVRLLREEDAEYVDMMVHKLDADVLAEVGFAQLAGETIIPNYFEPFEQRNITIGFAYKSDREPYMMFKGDSDQDRPNMI